MFTIFRVVLIASILSTVYCDEYNDLINRYASLNKTLFSCPFPENTVLICNNNKPYMKPCVCGGENYYKIRRIDLCTNSSHNLSVPETTEMRITVSAPLYEISYEELLARLERPLLHERFNVTQFSMVDVMCLPFSDSHYDANLSITFRVPKAELDNLKLTDLMYQFIMDYRYSGLALTREYVPPTTTASPEDIEELEEPPCVPLPPPPFLSNYQIHSILTVLHFVAYCLIVWIFCY